MHRVFQPIGRRKGKAQLVAPKTKWNVTIEWKQIHPADRAPQQASVSNLRPVLK